MRSRFFSCLHSSLTVTTVVGLLETLTVSNSAEFRSFLLNMCIDAPESTTSSSFIGEGAGRHHSLACDKKGALSFSLIFKILLANLHASSRAHRSCLSVSSWDLSPNFKAYGLRWWGNLTWIFASKGPLFSRMFAWCCVAFVNCTRGVDRKTFLLFRKIGKDSTGPTQPNCRAFFNIATRLTVNLPVCKWAHITKYTTRFRLLELTFGRMPIFTRWFGASTFQELLARLSVGLPRWTPASGALSRRTSTSWFWWFMVWSGFWCRFCTLIYIVLETTLVSISNTVLWLSIDSILLVLFQHHSIPCDS